MIIGEAPSARLTNPILIPSMELMFVQYMPIKFPYSSIKLPDNLKCLSPLISAIKGPFGNAIPDDHFIYITAKHLFVTPGNPGNRPGWHTDGFGSDDINYIWYDKLPTEFCVQKFDVSEDHGQSMIDMEVQANSENIRTYEPNTVLRLDKNVVHRSPIIVEGTYRKFVKISISKDLYNLKGNAHNYLFDYSWPMIQRNEMRNHPTA
jgi:hypothetical protein